MTTDTDLANSALALLGEMPITLITDAASRPAVVCNRFAASSRIEVLRLMHLTEGTLIASLDGLQKEAVAVRLAARIAVPLLGSHELQSKMEQLFVVRLQEAKTRILHTTALNGRILAMIGADLAKADLSPTMLTELVTTFQAEATKEVLRLTHAASEATLYAALTDSLMLEAIDARHAAKIAAALTLPSTPALEEIAAKRLQEAKTRVLHTSSLNGKILAMIGADLAKADLSTTMLTEFVTTYADEALEEVLRMGRWSSATKRAYPAPVVNAAWAVGTTYAANAVVVYDGTTYISRAGSNLAKEPTVTSGWATWWAVNEGYAYSYALPATCLRVLEVNGESVQNSNEYFEIEGAYLLSNSETCWIRYVDKITLAACDPLLALAITVRHASKIAAALTLPSTVALESLFLKRLAEARQADAQECGSRENPGWSRVFGRSRLMTAKGSTRNPLRLEDY